MNILRILRTRHFKLHISRRNNHTTTPTIVVVFTVMKMTFVNYAMLCCLSHVMWYCLMFVAEHLLPETNESEWKGRRVFAFSPSVSSGPSAQGWVHRTQPCEWVWIQPCLWGRPGTQKGLLGLSAVLPGGPDSRQHRDKTWLARRGLHRILEALVRHNVEHRTQLPYPLGTIFPALCISRRKYKSKK